MKNTLFAITLFAAIGCMNSVVHAAELLDVKPVVSGSDVSVEISADIPMTYTFYKVPGQARAVVDIAEADPEKVEPLIVVNKGTVSSISVDKAQISGIVVSRIIFNLVSESDISVNASSDRKLLTVTFGSSTASATTGKPEEKPVQKPEVKPVPLPEPVAKIEPPASAVVPPPAGAEKEEDPLGLDEPAAAAPPVKSVSAVSAVSAVAAVATVATVAAVTAPASGAALTAAPTVMRIPKLEPVVPATVTPAPLSSMMIKDIITGTSFIEIRANQAVSNYKTIKLTGPDRLVIDIASDKTNQKPKTIAVNKFGISKVRIGVSPNNIRIVLDSSKAGFPAHTITNTENGLRINFK